MQPTKSKLSIITDDDYRRGIHEAWEVAAHVEAKRFQECKGRPWTYDERSGFIERYLQTHNFKDRCSHIMCPVCEEMIYHMHLEGLTAFEIPPAIKAKLRSFSASFKPGRKSALNNNNLAHNTIHEQMRVDPFGDIELIS